MKRIFFFSILAILLVNVVHSKPKLHLPEKIIVLDTVSYSQKELHCKVPIVNKGDSPLYLTRSQVFCSCMKVSYSEEAVMPGDTALINVTYTFNHTEHFSNTVRLYYNTEDPEETEQFTLYGYIKEEDD